MGFFYHIPGNQKGLTRLCIRITHGAVIFLHGVREAFSWFNGSGRQGTVDASAALGISHWSLHVLLFPGLPALCMGAKGDENS